MIDFALLPNLGSTLLEELLDHRFKAMSLLGQQAVRSYPTLPTRTGDLLKIDSTNLAAVLSYSSSWIGCHSWTHHILVLDCYYKTF